MSWSAVGVRTVITAALALAACGGEQAAPEAKLPPVTAAAVEQRDLEDRIEATGELISPSKAMIAAEVAGRVTEVVKDEGEFVETGEAVMEIDPERRELELRNAHAAAVEARSALAETRRQTDRVRKLYREQIASKAQLDQAETAQSAAESRHSAAVAREQLAERAVRDASVTAPFAGQIARRPVSRGEFVNMGQPLFELVAVNPLEVEFHLTERDSARVGTGQRVGVAVAPYPGESFEGTVSMISPTIDSRTRTLRVKATIQNPDGRLRPGTFARVDLGIAVRPDVMLIPEEAVLQRADGAVVFRLRDDGSVERRIVQLGTHVDGAVEVIGLAASDRVVTRGHTELTDGVRVVVHAPDGSDAATAVSAAPQTGEKPE
jgi:membrane fusion protein (multidrug efflux system)